MSIAFDSVLNPVTHTGVSGSTSDSFDNVAGNIVIVAVEDRIGGDTVTGVTYGGDTMTLVGKRDDGTGNWTYMFIKVSAKTGPNSVSTSFTGTGQLRVTATSYSGCNPSGQPDNSTTSSASGNTSFTASLTPVAANCWVVLASWNNNNNTVAGTGSTLRGTATPLNLLDSNGPVASGSPYSMDVSWTGGASADWAYVVASLAPVAVSTASTRMLMGAGL